MQSMKRSISGITLIGFLMVLAVVGFFAYIAMKLFPVYSEYYGVLQAMKALQVEPAITNKTPDQIRSLLDRKFNISYVTSVKPNNIRITRNGGGYLLNIKYEVRDNMIYNIDFVAKFDKTIDLSRRGPE